MKLLTYFGGIVLFVGLFLTPIVSSQEIAVQGYDTNQSLRRGMVVGLDPDEPTKVEAIANDRADKVHGVVVDPNDAPFSVGNEGSKVYVATSGIYKTLISDANGSIKAGDFISLSQVEGVGQVAEQLQPLILGRALEDFIPGGGSLVLSTTTDSNGGIINIGSIQVDITVQRNPNQADPYKNVPEFLKRASDFVAGKPVSSIRIYASLAVLIVFAGISGSLIYSSMRTSITAVGRNPLGKKSIMRSLIQVVLVAFIILIAGVFTSYLMLRL